MRSINPLSVRSVELSQPIIFFFNDMLRSFFSLYQQNVIEPQFLYCINGTFVLELLTQLLKISKTYITEQGFTSMNTCSQNGKVFILVSRLHTFPVHRQIAQKIFKYCFCVHGITFEKLRQETGIQTFIENKPRRDILHD